METIEYPKMLLKDTMDNHAIAESEDEEKALRKDGYLSHDELIEKQAKPTAKTKAVTNDSTGASQ